ncbi:MAG: hypothetical protein ACON4Z_18310 [Planctomycetota bacterium]
MRYLPLLFGALLLAAPAKADKFWLSDPDAQAAAAPGSSPDVLEGVLLAEEDGWLRIRVAGGEVRLPKSAVFRVDPDNLDLAAIRAAEQAAAADGARADEQRRARQRQRREVRVAEASALRDARVVEAVAPRRAAPSPRFDPVLGVTTGVDSQLKQMRAAERAFALTRDRRYLKQLRRLRRLR